MKNVTILILGILLSCTSRKEVPHVIVVYPTSDTLTENLLRMYLQFSKPMKTVHNLEKIKLLDENDQEIKGAIFNNVYELWDENQTQLTLIFDPSRVKTGLPANSQLGRALKPGLSYRLKIDKLETINHEEIIPYVKEFYVVPADTVPPNTKNWNIQIPKAKTTTSLKIALNETADWMSLNHRITIADENKNQIDGTVEIGKQEKEWFFTPMESWKPGAYFISVNARFADPSGNNLNGLFDHQEGSLRFKSEDEVISIPFRILDH